MTWKTEFPDFPEADMPAIPADFVDTSWHNNACPSFTSDEAELTVWIDYLDVSQREHGSGHRFTIEPQRNGVEITGDWFSGDDWTEALAFIESNRAEVAARRAYAKTDRILLHYAVRDRATEGRDFLLFAVEDADEDSAEMIDHSMATLRKALRDGIDAELIITKAET
ncbi:hypothetical protein AB7M17_006722 [Bradyrhizobium sp. USDA 377]